MSGLFVKLFWVPMLTSHLQSTGCSNGILPILGGNGWHHYVSAHVRPCCWRCCSLDTLDTDDT
eukprot:342082-Amphidinium_carterae.1